MAKDNRYITSFLWPFAMLVLFVILSVRYHASLGAVIAGAILYLIALVWLIVQVINDGDNQWLPSAATLLGPVTVGIIAGANFF